MDHILSTYRLQLNKDFTFKELDSILYYLKELGVNTIYASPVFKAVAGSNHGYDVLDPTVVNPEIGSYEAFIDLLKKIQADGMYWLQDIVPNHMGFFPENPWIFDILEKGRRSNYVAYFDINFDQGQLMLPFLGAPLHDVIQNNELKCGYKEGRLVLQYFDATWPVNARTYELVLQQFKEDSTALQQLKLGFESLHNVMDPKVFHGQWHEIMISFQGLMKAKNFEALLNAAISNINLDHTLLQQIAEQQSYRLCHWQEADGNINFRRFFTVNSLICLNMQHPEVFDQHHHFILSMVKDGWIQGLRIDHIDGLLNPRQYLEKLRSVSDNLFITVEKILEPGENLPVDWPVQGTTGYDFLGLVNNLQTKSSSEEKFTRYYNTLANEVKSLPQQVRDKKAMILYHHMGGELENLYQLFMTSGLVHEQDFAQMRTEDIKTAIAEFLIHCPVYRYYGNHYPLQENELQEVQKIFVQLKTSRPDLSRAADLLENVMLFARNVEEEQYRNKAIYFYQRCMQFTGPLMAKGVEDTLMYTFNRFIGHNEVGDAPDAFGITVDEFHHAMQQRQELWPLAMNTTATHDTKRGEDVRARLNVLSQLPEQWFSMVEEWRIMNADLKTDGAPEINDEYFIYQTLAGTWPFEPFEIEHYKERLVAYFVKAFRESKQMTTWTKPEEKYEAAVGKFVDALLNESNSFYHSITAFVKQVSDHGIINSLTQTILTATCPGIPDTYQGTELWDLSMVDPDNRRPVDYECRKKMLREIRNEENEVNFPERLWNERQSGKIKLFVKQLLLHLRQSEKNIFLRGEYIPVQVEGKYKSHIICFARKFREQVVLITLPLFTADFKNEKMDWEDTRILIPFQKAAGWQELAGRKDLFPENEITINQLFQQFPFSILKGTAVESERAAGLLLHISSLPGNFGCGDLGPAAYAFAGKLADAGIKYWQILPLNPTEEGQGFSPYSATSAFAGNELFISPELLQQQGLLTTEDLSGHLIPSEDHADFIKAKHGKQAMLKKAFARFKKQGASSMQTSFQSFIRNERKWLNDFSIYALLKQLNEGKPWYKWDAQMMQRDVHALKQLQQKHSEAIEYIHWVQFMFDQQWTSLKNHCNASGIRIMGDLPFYVSYDSADVWANQELFLLDENGKSLAVAGVPPDAFSADGQLWGMPVYNWEQHAQTNYGWWTQRLKKNHDHFDLIRLDHFRAFEAYWEVPAGDHTAKNGKWIKGPGKTFFEAIIKNLGALPFVAEDLGEITPEVYALRDAFGFPGMKVLQFAFGENFSHSEHIPHLHEKNFLVYTGTHDNNTTRGWYRTEADIATKERISKYAGKEINEENVAAYMMRLALASVAAIAIIPVQDVLALDESARMNIPASSFNNWSWRLKEGTMNHLPEQLKEWVRMYSR